MNLNKVILAGRLTADPELKTTPSGLSVTSFTVAVDRRFGKDKQTDFISCVAWRQTAEFISRYFHKGSMIAINGSIQQRQYTDKNGNKRRSAEVVADSVYFADNRRPDGNDTATPQYAAESAAGGFAEVSEDDGMLPF